MILINIIFITITKRIILVLNSSSHGLIGENIYALCISVNNTIIWQAVSSKIEDTFASVISMLKFLKKSQNNFFFSKCRSCFPCNFYYARLLKFTYLRATNYSQQSYSIMEILLLWFKKQRSSQFRSGFQKILIF